MAKRAEGFIAAFGRSPSDYDYADSLSDSDWAWEFLRHNPEYRSDYRASRKKAARPVSHASGVRIYRPRGCLNDAAKWGLAAFVDPDLNARQADIFWLKSALTHTVNASSLCVGTDSDEADLDLFRDRNCAAILCGTERQEIVVRSEKTSVSVSVEGTNVLLRPVNLTFHLHGFASVERGTKALIWTTSALKQRRCRDMRTLSRTARLNRKKQLVALECHQTGGSLQDTAHVFRALRLTRLSWSASGDEALKKQVWRSRNAGLSLMRGGYRKFL
ncbi:DUF6499 domain-containing protein [Nitratireductor sp. XY-223]|uniref:transcriptional regulator domain-containing protein n=1 Tax=Nitratireductor sp. XY-223 TaxID=2561926 RepID=UPI0010A9D093|nr:DUF6499 domain-containing protein [Nitratireductor sp. XY-223]